MHFLSVSKNKTNGLNKRSVFQLSKIIWNATITDFLQIPLPFFMLCFSVQCTEMGRGQLETDLQFLSDGGNSLRLSGFHKDLLSHYGHSAPQCSEIITKIRESYQLLDGDVNRCKQGAWWIPESLHYTTTLGTGFKMAKRNLRRSEPTAACSFSKPSWDEQGLNLLKIAKRNLSHWLEARAQEREKQKSQVKILLAYPPKSGCSKRRL